MAVIGQVVGERRVGSIAPALMLAVAYSQVKNLRKALHLAQTAVRRSRRPQESWLQLQLSLHYELKHRWEVVHVLERLIARYPKKKSYWIQLAAIYSQLKEDRRLLAVLDLRARTGP